MPNRMFQNVVDQMKEQIGRTIGVVDESCVILASSDQSRIGYKMEGLVPDDFNTTEPYLVGPFTVKCFSNYPGKAEYAVYVDGTDAEALVIVNLMAVSLANIKTYHDEKFDKGNFIKNVILDNILSGDIYLKSRELHFNNDATRVCMLIKVSNRTEISVYDILHNLFPDKSKDYVININETDIALVKEIKSNIDRKDIEKLASSIVDTLSSEFFTHCNIGIGSVVEGIKDLARSFREAQVAIEVGKVFDTEKNIVRYDNLGIARLIYQLPTTLCGIFLKEVFKMGSIESLDHETLFTIHKFFENNLNVSETSRRLFVHRNTLVYRLEKIKKITGLDLREFEDAIVFKVALMVKKYLSASPTKF